MAINTDTNCSAFLRHSSDCNISVGKSCDDVGLPRNGGSTAHPSPRNFVNGIPDGYTVYFGCFGSKTIVGPTRSTCQDGTWSQRPPACESEEIS